MLGSELVVHAGLHQTHTAVLQGALRRLRPQLGSRGIGFVDHAAMSQLPGLGGWQRELVSDPAATRAFERALGLLVSGEEAEVTRRSGDPPRATIVSSDDLLGRRNIDQRDEGRFRPFAVPAVAQAIRATAASTVRVVLYIRRQDRFMELCYLRAIEEGGHHTFAQHFPRRFEPVLDYGELIDRLRGLPEVREVHVRPIEFVRSDAAGRADDLLAVLGQRGQFDLDEPEPDVTPEPRYSHRALRIALDINGFLETERERSRVREFLTEQFPGGDDDTTRFLSEDDRGRILDAYAPTNRRLFERYLPDLPVDAYATDRPPAVLSPPTGTATSPHPADSCDHPVAPSEPAPRPIRATSLTAVARPAWLTGIRLRYQARRADVLLRSAPGCGSGWLRMMLGMAMARHAGWSTHDPLRFTEAVSAARLPRILAVPSDRVENVRRDMTLGGRSPKVVVVVRDPRQVLASLRGAGAGAEDRQPPRARSAPAQRTLRDLDELLGFYDAWEEERRRRPDEVMIVRYEDMIRDAPAVLHAVLGFAGLGLVEPRWLHRAVAESSFGELAREQGDLTSEVSIEEARFVDDRIRRSAGAEAFDYVRELTHVRRGRVPGGREEARPDGAGDPAGRDARQRPGRRWWDRGRRVATRGAGRWMNPNRPVSRARGPDFDQVTFPIDVVYTWVDGDDPEWVASRVSALAELQLDGHPVDAVTPSRYQDHGELRYSLRSVAEFAPFVRHVFIVTDGQAPEWLNLGSGRITVVDHREIFADEDCLPTFNSHAIECRLHHIDGLAEHYLYMNDDFFFGRPVSADRFFHANGMTKFFLSPAAIGGGEPGERRSVDAAALNTRRLIRERFGREVDRKFRHAPYPQRRSVLFEMEAVLRDEFERTAASRIRGHDDVAIPSSLFHYYSYLTGRAVPGSIRSRYVSLDERRLPGRLRALRRKRNFDVVCINDSLDGRAVSRDRRGDIARRFMGSYWPTKSPFER